MVHTVETIIQNDSYLIFTLSSFGQKITSCFDLILRKSKVDRERLICILSSHKK